MLTNQYDAEFGRSAGAIINAITRQGGNALSRRGLRQLTRRQGDVERFLRSTGEAWTNRVSSQTDWGGTLGGPILKDKMHFFYSLDRIVYEEGRSNTFAARPELNYANTQTMKLWNNLIRVDGQVSPFNTGTSATSKETSPTYDLVSGRVDAGLAPAGVRHRPVLATAPRTSSFRNTSTPIRVGYTYERNGFTNKELQANPPAAMIDLPPTLNMLTFTDGTTPGALPHRQLIRSRDTLLQFIPDWLGGNNDFKVGRRSSTRRSSCPIKPT